MPLQMVCKSYLYLTIHLSTSIPDHAIIGWPSPVHSLVTPQFSVPKMCFHPPHHQKKNWFIRCVQYEWRKELSTLAMVRMSMARLQFQLFSGISGSSLRTAFRCFWMTSTCATWVMVGDGLALVTAIPGSYSNPQEPNLLRSNSPTRFCNQKDAEKEHLRNYYFRAGLYFNLHLNLRGCYKSIEPPLLD